MAEQTEKQIVKALKDLGYTRADGKKIDDTNWLKPDLELLLKAAEHLAGLDVPKPGDMDPADVQAELTQRSVEFKPKGAASTHVKLLVEARLNFVVDNFKAGNSPEPPPVDAPPISDDEGGTPPEGADPTPPPAGPPAPAEKKVAKATVKKDKKTKAVTAQAVKDAVMEGVMGMFDPPVLMDIKTKMDRGENVPINATVRISPQHILRLHAMIQPPKPE